MFASIVAVGLCGVSYGLLFSYRTDYLGHFLAGVGGTLLLVALLLWLRRPRFEPEALGAVLLAIAFGVITEVTIFSIAIFDPVDFFNQSLGAVLAGAIVLGYPSRQVRPHPVPLAIASLILLGGGFIFAFA